jgi:hypothetical protein
METKPDDLGRESIPPVEAWRRRWQPIPGESFTPPLPSIPSVEVWRRRWQPTPEETSTSPAPSNPHQWRWWQILLLAPFGLATGLAAVGISLLVVLSVVSAIVTGESIDPRMTDIFYWNDTDQPVVVWECPIDCDNPTNSYHLEPGKKKIYQPYNPKHPVPPTLLVTNEAGMVLGCVQQSPSDRSNNLYYRVSTLIDCDLITPVPGSPNIPGNSVDTYFAIQGKGEVRSWHNR